ncbi:DarT ssDNA thymidine ADP-ribosyltransferase family protein [Acinetobacter baumannii]|uniref:DarT ssDNA thymidine ADP-ribosyltransferase family protein n=1 Tax=Acinetobacter baumannii TaxID=470 RepID=UPI0007D7E8B2|nr:DarT ssDNA thymidine ADP-ribosyltransferase family protein [Acinetobacter baumannii]MDH2535038.1 DarT ssDNA thymidine ADP-ribosyltransferase family protein [Acinetobacter baumannii]OAM07703.1 hypothetical protein AZK46_16435 [Acinetobacter baumannii]
MPTPQEITAIQKIVQERKIPYLVHFTRVNNLPSILQHGIVSQNLFSQINNQPLITDPLRLDNKRDYSCFSIAFPNHRMFYRARNNIIGDWVLIRLSTQILWDYDCLFYPINAADNLVRFRDINDFQGSIALSNLFLNSDENPRESFLHSYDPTNDQSEVMVPGVIGSNYIQDIIFDSQQVAQDFINRIPDHGKQLYYCPPNQKFYTTRKACRYGH